MRAIRLVPLALALVLAGCGASSDPVGAQAGCDAAPGAGTRWLSAWGGTRTGGTAPANATIRNMARVTAGGSAIRLRFFNLGATPITIGKATAALRAGASGAALKAGTAVPVTFGCGEAGVVIPPNTASLYSDPVPLAVAALDEVAVSLFVPDSASAAEFSTEWNYSYVGAAGSGDLTADEAGTALATTSNALYALRDIEVLTAEATGAMTFLGSSSFHGSNSTRDGHFRVSDQISVRVVQEIAAGARKTVVNRGIGGDTLENAFRTRMEQDIWSTEGVDTVVVWVTNDLTSRSADEVIADYVDLKAQAHARGIAVICPTWVPGAQSGPALVNGERDKVNEWIRAGNCDAWVDYGKMVENETVPYTWKPEYLTDHIHTNDDGHTLWASETPVAEWVALQPR